MITHEDLLRLVKRLPEDHLSFGQYDMEAQTGRYTDCSQGCRFFAELAGDLGMDWGVCSNPASHRAGLLTFEHQGCAHFVASAEEEED